MNETLVPSPFCQSADVFVIDEFATERGLFAKVVCRNCGASSGEHRSREAAVTALNQRPMYPAEVERAIAFSCAMEKLQRAITDVEGIVLDPLFLHAKTMNEDDLKAIIDRLAGAFHRSELRAVLARKNAQAVVHDTNETPTTTRTKRQ